MNRIKKAITYSSGILSVLFVLLSDNFLEKVTFIPCFSIALNVLICKILLIASLFILMLTGVFIKEKMEKKVRIKGDNYEIVVEYGNLFQMHNCKKVVSFDDCFTTKVGTRPEEINPSSVCGQYLLAHPLDSIEALLADWGVSPIGRLNIGTTVLNKYESGTIIPRNDYLLLAFAHLDSTGLGRMTYDEYLNCLSLLWKEIDKHYGGTDVCMPILGAGITRFGDVRLTKQELLDTMIYSYKLNRNKLRLPNKLHIVCIKSEDFSLQNIGVRQ